VSVFARFWQSPVGGGTENARLGTRDGKKYRVIKNVEPNCRTGKGGKRHVWKAKWCTPHVVSSLL